MANVANGLAYSAKNSQWPLAMNSSSWRSTSCHMKSSFSFSRFGVNNLVSKERARVWAGGSMTTRCSLIGNMWRCASISAVMSSPSGSNGNGGKGPPIAFIAEKASVSLKAAMTSA